MKRLTTTALVQAVLQCDETMTNATRLTLVAIANRYNAKTGQCNPTRQVIARDAHVTVRSVERAIEQGKKLGILSWLKLSFMGRHPNNSYCWQGLCPNALPAWQGNAETHVVSGKSSTVDKKETTRKVSELSNQPVSFQTCSDLLNEWSKEGPAEKQNAEMTSRYIQYRNFNEDDADLFIRQAQHIAPFLWDGDIDDNTPALAHLLGRSISEGWKSPINFSWRIDSAHNKEKVLKEHQQII